VLNVSERGDRAYIGIDPGERLDHPWSGNVVDLCPVGSLISKDFLHKARAWDLDKTASVCPGCTQGCNIMIDTRDEVVVRLRPRANLEVNRHFICDVGRADYRWMNRGDRVEAPLLREPARTVPVDWDTALDRLASLVEESSGPVVVLASGRASIESLGWLRRLVDARDLTAAVRVPLGEEAPLPGIPDLALRRERIPNLDGARLFGYSDDWDAAVARAAGAALVLLLDAPLTDAEAARLGTAGAVVSLATLEEDRLAGSGMVLPVTTMAEENGTYMNRDGRVQRFTQAKAPPGMARPGWWVAAEAWARLAGGREPPGSAAQAFAALGSGVPALAGLSYADLGVVGRVVDGAGAGRPAAAGKPA
jgi:NADH-quinone oxidoreductase subunit G